jgi:hypothetical protein
MNYSTLSKRGCKIQSRDAAVLADPAMKLLFQHRGGALATLGLHRRSRGSSGIRCMSGVLQQPRKLGNSPLLQHILIQQGLLLLCRLLHCAALTGAQLIPHLPVPRPRCAVQADAGGDGQTQTQGGRLFTAGHGGGHRPGCSCNMCSCSSSCTPPARPPATAATWGTPAASRPADSLSLHQLLQRSSSSSSSCATTGRAVLACCSSLDESTCQRRSSYRPPCPLPPPHAPPSLLCCSAHLALLL